MTDAELRQLADAAGRVLRPHLERSEPLRLLCLGIAQWLGEESRRAAGAEGAANTGAQANAETNPEAGADGASKDQPPDPAPRTSAAPRAGGPGAPAARPSLPMSSALVPLKLGDAVVHVPLTGTTAELGRARAAAAESVAEPATSATESAAAREIDLPLVERRCRLKAASCRVFVERRATAAGSLEERKAVERLNEMIAQAKAMPQCFLWVFWRNQVQPDDATLEQIAASYDALAEATALVRRVDGAGTPRPAGEETTALRLMAAATSALREALATTWLSADDQDQSETYAWLRREAAARRIYIDRHMTADDPADPANTAALRAQIEAEAKRAEEREAAARKVRNALGQTRYHAGLLAKGGPEEAPAHWLKIAEAIRRLEELGVPASDRRVAEAVGPAAAATWTPNAAAPDHLAGVVARALALGEAAKGEGDRAERETEERVWSDGVLAARSLLRGRRMVIVGGERYAEAARRLTQAFELSEAEWVVLSEHGSGQPLRAPIQRADTAVVVVIIKLTGHLHAEEARQYAAAAGKPCVMLSGGYNPERVAAEILEQASDRLGR